MGWEDTHTFLVERRIQPKCLLSERKALLDSTYIHMYVVPKKYILMRNLVWHFQKVRFPFTCILKLTVF